MYNSKSDLKKAVYDIGYSSKSCNGAGLAFNLSNWTDHAQGKMFSHIAPSPELHISALTPSN